MTVGGWFDAEDLFGALETYKTVEKNSPGAYNILVMGPWYHGGWARSDGDSLGSVQFGGKTAAFYRENIELPFFNYYLKDKGQLKLPDAYVFETGSNRWQTYDQWPPRNARVENLYFQADGKLSFDAPTSRSGSRHRVRRIHQRPEEACSVYSGNQYRNDALSIWSTTSERPAGGLMCSSIKQTC